MDILIEKAAKLIKNSKRTGVFTGSGISVESGIPSFRGENGIWSKYNPQCLNLDFFHENPDISWPIIKKVFYDNFSNARFNRAHEVLAILEQKGLLAGLTTQNIDNLHQEAGSKTIYEFHGNSKKLVCTSCKKSFKATEETLKTLPPYCKPCGGLLKPDFIFFGEGIPEEAYQLSVDLAKSSEVYLVIGTTGEVVPANYLPLIAKKTHASIIEINTQPSRFTGNVTDVFLQGKATEMLDKLLIEIEKLN